MPAEGLAQAFFERGVGGFVTIGEKIHDAACEAKNTPAPVLHAIDDFLHEGGRRPWLGGWCFCIHEGVLGVWIDIEFSGGLEVGWI